jgi:beta-N-acetylhexosaminidase
VDEAVLRILRLKLRLYGGLFSRQLVQPVGFDPEEFSLGGDITFEVARSAASLITPLQESLEDRIQGPPQLGERIVFFSDVRSLRQCSSCQSHAEISLTAMEEMVLSLYGPAAAGQVGGWNLRSFSMADLAHYLGATPPTNLVPPLAPRDQLVDPISAADWLVFLILNSSDEVFGSNALKMLLDQRPDLARGNRVVVFAMDVPYGLDATDLSKVDAYYGLYSRGTAFIDVAAHLLFLELSAPGAPPVSVPGVGYDLIDATTPDPTQVISLHIQAEDEELLSGDSPQAFSVGDLISVKTGVILDANGHHVPDGTVVEFTLSWQGEAVVTQVTEATTSDGVAEISVPLDKLGLLTVFARSDPARISETLQLNVQEDIPALATVISPTMFPTNTPIPTETPQSPTPTTAPEDSSPSEEETARAGVSLLDYFIGLSAVAAAAFISFRSKGIVPENVLDRTRASLLIILFGLLGYDYLALGLPGSSAMLESMGWVVSFFLPLLCGGVGFALAWYLWGRPKSKQS